MKDIFLVTTKEGADYAFNNFKLVEQFIAPLKNGSFYFRKIAVLENEKEVELLSNYEQSQNQPQ